MNGLQSENVWLHLFSLFANPFQCARTKEKQRNTINCSRSEHATHTQSRKPNAIEKNITLNNKKLRGKLQAVATLIAITCFVFRNFLPHSLSLWELNFILINELLDSNYTQNNCCNRIGFSRHQNSNIQLSFEMKPFLDTQRNE